MTGDAVEAGILAPQWWTRPDSAPFEEWSAQGSEEPHEREALLEEARGGWELRNFELELLEAVQDLGDAGEAEDVGDEDEIEYDAELDEAADLLVARYAWGPDEATGPTPPEVVYPNGTRLRVVSAPDGPGEEYHDPNASSDPARNVPLVDTSGANKSIKLSKDFTVGELARSGRITYDIARIDPRLISCLQALGDRTGRPVKVNSGYRSYLYNIGVYQRNGKQRKPTNSQHSSGKAADIRIPGLTGMQIAQAALDVCGCDLGVGIANTSAHIDVRGRFARWTYFGAGTPADQAALSAITAYQRARCRTTKATAGSRPAEGSKATGGSRAAPPEAAPGSAIGRIREALARGAWSVAVGLAASAGLTDTNKLTNLVFFSRHPELAGRPIRPDERNLANEWRTIRDTIVQPVLDRRSNDLP